MKKDNIETLLVAVDSIVCFLTSAIGGLILFIWFVGSNPIIDLSAVRAFFISFLMLWPAFRFWNKTTK